MIDKLILRSKQDLNLQEVIKKLTMLSTEKRPDKIYKHCLVVRKKGKQVITIKTNPIWGHVYPTELQLNPTNWENFGQLASFLNQIAYTALLKIKRIDHAVDIKTPLEQVYRSLRVKFKQGWKEHSEKTGKCSKMTGYYLGREPEVFCIYDKGYQKSEGRKLARVKSQELGIKTRIEVRQSKNKVKHQLFKDLPNYIDYNPFFRVELLNLAEQEKTKSLVTEVGAFRAHYLLNKNQNFKRDYGQQLNTDSADFLTNQYKLNLLKYFQIKEEAHGNA